MGEDRILRRADHGLPFPRVLRGVGGSEHRAPVTHALERRFGDGFSAGGRTRAARKRAAVAAIEDEHLPARAARIHPIGDEGGGDGGGLRQIALGVFGGQIQAAFVVEHAVAGEVQQQQLIGLALREEAGDGAAGDRLRLIDHGAHRLELADGAVAQQLRQPAHIGPRRFEFGQRWVFVMTVADDEGVFAGHGLQPPETLVVV